MAVAVDNKIFIQGLKWVKVPGSVAGSSEPGFLLAQSNEFMVLIDILIGNRSDRRAGYLARSVEILVAPPKPGADESKFTTLKIL